MGTVIRTRTGKENWHIYWDRHRSWYTNGSLDSDRDGSRCGDWNRHGDRKWNRL